MVLSRYWPGQVRPVPLPVRVRGERAAPPPALRSGGDEPAHGVEGPRTAASGDRIGGDDEERAILEQVKALESRGFQYEGAEASFELLVLRSQPNYRSPFELVDFMVVIEKRRRSSTLESGEGMRGLMGFGASTTR